jgi:hypothetical protein
MLLNRDGAGGVRRRKSSWSSRTTDPDVQFLVETLSSMDSRFTIGSVAVSAEEALASVRTPEPEIIVLIHGLSGKLKTCSTGPASRDDRHWR